MFYDVCVLWGTIGVYTKPAIKAIIFLWQSSLVTWCHVLQQYKELASRAASTGEVASPLGRHRVVEMGRLEDCCVLSESVLIFNHQILNVELTVINLLNVFFFAGVMHSFVCVSVGRGGSKNISSV